MKRFLLNSYFLVDKLLTNVLYFDKLLTRQHIIHVLI